MNLSCMLYGPGKAKFENRPLPQIEDPHDVLVRISFVGVCGSDVHFWTHGGITRHVSEQEPLVMGHEASGIVHAIGPAVTTVSFGDRVAIEPGFPCRRCKLCKAGKYNLCSEMRFAADPPGTHGVLTQLFRVPEDFIHRIPECLSLQEAVLVEPLSVAVHGVRMANLAPGQAVLVQGSGTVGLLCAAVASAFGAKTICVADINETKLDFARSFVNCMTFLSDPTVSPADDAARFKKENRMPNGVDVVLECTGVQSSAQTGLHASAAGSTFVQIGMGRPEQTLPLGTMMEKEVTLKTSFRYGPGDYDIAIELLSAGKVQVGTMISSVVPFEHATEAWEKTKRGTGIKNLIQGVQD